LTRYTKINVVVVVLLVVAVGMWLSELNCINVADITDSIVALQRTQLEVNSVI